MSYRNYYHNHIVFICQQTNGRNLVKEEKLLKTDLHPASADTINHFFTEYAGRFDILSGPRTRGEAVSVILYLRHASCCYECISEKSQHQPYRFLSFSPYNSRRALCASAYSLYGTAPFFPMMEFSCPFPSNNTASFG